MEYEPEAKSTSSIAQSPPLSQRKVIPESRDFWHTERSIKSGVAITKAN